MKTIILLAMHGIPPNDYPKKDLADFFKLYSIVESSGHALNVETKNQYDELHTKIRKWPRNNQNDPFYVTSQELATKLSNISGYEVIVGYNEFCSPSLDEALQSAITKKAEKIVVTTTMMTGGGDHSEKDIPQKIKEFTRLNPNIKIIYAWPYEKDDIVDSLHKNLRKYL